MSTNYHFQPRDRSLQAFREWLEGQYNPKPKKTTAAKPWLAEKEWIENWKKYWAKMDGSSKGKKSSEK